MRTQTHESKVLDIVKMLPGSISKDIVTLLEGEVPPNIVRSHLAKLCHKGALQFTLIPSGNPRGRQNVKSYSIATNPPKSESSPSLADELEVLRAFRQRAIDQYPDLAVDPAILKARNIVLEVIGTTHQSYDDVKAGRKDSCPLMRVALRALEL
jgi:hypothetical protein